MALFDDQWFTGLQTAMTAIGSAAAAVVATAMVIRRKLSSDSVEIAKDRTEKAIAETERDFLVRIMGERDRAVTAEQTAWKQRVEDAQRIAMLEAQLNAATEKVNNLTNDMFAVRLQLQKAMAVLVKLDPTAMQLLEVDRHGIDRDVLKKGPT